MDMIRRFPTKFALHLCRARAKQFWGAGVPGMALLCKCAHADATKQRSRSKQINIDCGRDMRARHSRLQSLCLALTTTIAEVSSWLRNLIKIELKRKGLKPG